MAIFSDLISYTRTGSAYFVNKFGLLELAGPNTPRLEFDLVQLSRLGLLVEEQRSNLIANSSTFEGWTVGGAATVAANTTVAPDGTATADTATFPTSATGINSSTFSIGAGVLVAFSVFAKQGNGLFAMQLRNVAGTQIAIATANTNTGTITPGATTSATISMVYKEAAPQGYDRYVMVASLAVAETNNARVALSGSAGSNSPILWGAQCEVGGSATSHIPTTTAAATRGADIATPINTVWLAPGAGTLFVEARPFAATPAAAPYTWELRNASTPANRIALSAQTNGALSGAVLDAGGATQASFVVSPTASPRRWAMAYANNDFAFCVNGGAVSIDTAGTVPNPLSAGSIGYSATLAGRQWNGHIRKIRHYPRRLSNTELQGITA